MFKFDEHPEIKKAHKEYEKLSQATYKAEFRYEKSGKQADNDFWKKCIECAEIYDRDEYSKIIFDVFLKIKPDLVNIRTEQHEKWDSVITSNDFNNLSNKEKIFLVGIIEREGLYRLPKEYYK